MNKTGNQLPTYHYSTEYSRSEGKFAAELSKYYALKPHPWQEEVLNDWLAVDETGHLINNFCLLQVPRQNGKTGVSDPRETWGLVRRGEKILHTAQEFQTAKKAFDRLRKKFGDKVNDPYCEYPELNALVSKYTLSAGQMILDLKNGGHIEFRTRGNNSDMGRGGTFDLVVIDEAQAYTEEQDAALSPLNSAAPSGSPQTILMGTPPKLGDKGVVFARAREMLHKNPIKGQCISEWTVDDIGDVNDRKRWYETNPSLGYQLLETALEKDVISMSPDTFAMEHLGYFPKAGAEAEHPIKESKWNACASDDPKPEGKTAYGVKFSPDGSEVCLCGAVIPEDGPARISIIDRRNTSHGIRWLSDWLNERHGSAACVVIDGRNGVDLLIERISPAWRMKDSIIRPTVKDVLASVSTLMNEINEQTITWYKPQAMLKDSALSATKRTLAGGWAFGGDDCTPIEAAALAIWGARTSKRNPGKRMRIG